MRMLGLVASIGCICAAVTFNCSALPFLNIPSAIMVFGIGFGCVGLAHGMKGIALLLNAAFSDVPSDATEAAAKTAKTAHMAFVGAGVVGVLVGVVQLCHSFHDVKLIGPALAIILLSSLYSFVCCTVLWLPTQRRMETSHP